MAWNEPDSDAPRDHCGCPKPMGCWGQTGWHFRPDEQYPKHRQMGHAYERCAAYSAAVAKGEREGW